MCTGGCAAAAAASAGEVAAASSMSMAGATAAELAAAGVGSAAGYGTMAGIGTLGAEGLLGDAALAGLGDMSMGLGGVEGLAGMSGMDMAADGLLTGFEGLSGAGLGPMFDAFQASSGVDGLFDAGQLTGGFGGQTIVPGEGGLASRGLTSLGQNTVGQGTQGFLNGGGNAASSITGNGAGYMPMTSTPVGGGGLQDIMNGARGALGKMAPVQLASGLYDMYAKNQMADAQRDQYNQMNARVNNMYAPGSPEYNLMKQEMERKDAAAGRNSQYGTRATELAGKIAGLKTNALIQAQTGQNALFQSSMNNRYGGLNSLFAQYGKANAPGLGGLSNAQNGMILT